MAQQEQVPQDAEAVYIAREAVLIDEVEVLRRARGEAEATITAAQLQMRHADEGLRCWEPALNEYRRRHGRPYDPEGTVYAGPGPYIPGPVRWRPLPVGRSEPWRSRKTISRHTGPGGRPRRVHARCGCAHRPCQRPQGAWSRC